MLVNFSNEGLKHLWKDQHVPCGRVLCSLLCPQGLVCGLHHNRYSANIRLNEPEDTEVDIWVESIKGQ